MWHRNIFKLLWPPTTSNTADVTVFSPPNLPRFLGQLSPNLPHVPTVTHTVKFCQKLGAKNFVDFMTISNISGTEQNIVK